MAKTLYCPICRKEVPVDSPDVPFCSDRCRLLDLGKWASGDYRVSSPVLDPELLEDVEQAQFDAERRREGRDKD
jgi:endogenous inhibitor of DNA gyrase (YacG/DUF329 family)